MPTTTELDHEIQQAQEPEIETMADSVLSDGRSAAAKALARRIISTQRAEIVTMRGWL